MSQTLLILGASSKPDRYAHKAFKLLQGLGHKLILVNRGVTEIEGQAVIPDIADVAEPYDVLTVYVRADVSTQLADAILKQKPQHVIFNPGAENPALKQRLTEAGTTCYDACTLVLYRTGQAPAPAL
jgi:uncharacterized protein